MPLLPPPLGLFGPNECRGRFFHGCLGDLAVGINTAKAKKPEVGEVLVWEAIEGKGSFHIARGRGGSALRSHQMAPAWVQGLPRPNPTRLFLLTF